MLFIISHDVVHFLQEKNQLFKLEKFTIFYEVIMSISSVGNSYSAYTFQWQNQSLQGSSTNPAASTSTSTSSNFSYQGASTVSSMIELIQYSMEAMGVSENERVTFSQVDAYKEELSKEFSKELSARITATGVNTDAFFSVTLDTEGKILINSAHEDKAKIQSHFSSNPNFGTDLLKSIEQAGYDVSEPIQFNVDGTGAVSLVSSSQSALQSAFEGNNVLGAGLIESLELEELLFEEDLELNYNNGALTVNAESENASELQAYIDANPNLAAEVKAILEGAGKADLENLNINIDNKGNISINAPLENNDESLESFLIQNLVGQDMKTSLKSHGIDPNVDFRLSIENGKVIVNSSHPDAALVQALIDSDEELSKTYMQIDALAGIDAARQAMQVDPSALRTQIEMQSMSTWWAQSGTSSFSSYADSSLSSMTGISSIV